MADVDNELATLLDTLTKADAVDIHHEDVLKAETADTQQRRHEAVLAAEAVDIQQYRHEEVLAAELVEESDNALFGCIRTEFALCAAPLDAILAEIA